MRTWLSGHVVVWCLNLDTLSPASEAALDDLLADQERASAARFSRAEDRRAAAIVRALAKGLLAAETGTQAPDWRLGRAAGGAPLAFPPDLRPPPGLSLSRTRGAVAAAVSDAGEVGVDIERVAGTEAAVAQALFAPVDLATLRGEGDTADAFTRVWTLKEAVLKALGTGFALPPSHVGVLSLEPPRIGFGPGYAEARGWSLAVAARGPFRVGAACRGGAGTAEVVVRWVRVSPSATPRFLPEP